MSGNVQHGSEGGHGSVTSYMLGLAASIVLTLIAFGIVMSEGHWGLGTNGVVAVIAVTAVLQILVQLVCFMHMGTSSLDQQSNLLAFLFTLITLAILVVGSIWVMYHLHFNMHP